MKKLIVAFLLLGVNGLSFTMEEQNNRDSEFVGNLIDSDQNQNTFEQENLLQSLPYDITKTENINDFTIKAVHALLGKTTGNHIKTAFLRDTLLSLLGLTNYVIKMPDNKNKEVLYTQIDTSVEILRSFAQAPYSNEFKQHVIQQIFIVHGAFLAYLTVSKKTKTEKET
ncbi:hypothetical protein KC460_01955 [Candidatus Dependentiae bacterium]|nr:hypothetical protein [Candidatus Dependentiae bacterium]